MESKQMTNEEMEQFIAENINLVPANQRKRFATFTIEKKVDRINHYIRMKELWADAKEKNKMSNRVKEMMTKRNATIQDALDIINMCKQFISESRKSEIIRLGEEIAKLEEMKKQLETE